MLGGRILDHLLVRFLVVFPEAALLDVVHRKLPILLRILQPLQKSFLLFFLRDVKKELPNHRAVPRQIAFERINVLVPLGPNVFRYQRFRYLFILQQHRVHADDQHFLIVRAIKYPDLSALGHHLVAAPKKTVTSFSVVGALNPMTSQPWGFTPVMTCLMAPSFPAASMP